MASMSARMKALVTGGAGFIGSHIAEALCRRGARVIVLDDLSYGNEANLDWKRAGDELEFVRGDIRDRAVVKKVLPGVDWVFHEAAVASVAASVSEPEMTNQVNLTASLELLQAAREAGVKRFMFASSCAVYRDSDQPVKKEGEGEGPASPYGLQKYAAEKYCGLYSSLFGLETVSLRYFNVFGPRQSANSPYSGVIARFCAALLEQAQPVIFGDGEQSRDFVNVADVVKANLLAAEAPAEQVGGKFFNIGTGRRTSVLELFTSLAKAAGSSVKPRHEPARAGEIRHAQADISSARRGLGFEPGVSLDVGLQETFEAYRKGMVNS